MYSNKENVNILTALLVKHGVEHIVVCPGSRNAPLVHNFNECPDIICHPVTDERSAGFIALGLTLQLNAPVAVCVTSGSALLNVLPAAAEATYQQCGIIVISADRPAAWIDQLDGQTCPQQNALGKFVAKSVTLPEPHNDAERWHCNRLINEAFIQHFRAHHPSIHINVPISEPLFDFSVEQLPNERVVRCWQWNVEFTKEFVVNKIKQAERPMFIIGQTKRFCIPEDDLNELSKRYVILSEPISGGELPQSFTDQMLYAIGLNQEDYHPDMVIFIGVHTVSKRLRQFMRSLSKNTLQIVVSQNFELRDISQNTRLIIQGLADDFISDINKSLKKQARSSAFYNKWKELRKHIQERHKTFMPKYSQMLAVKFFEKELEKQNDVRNQVYYANSMSVRLASLYAKHYCGCNRGLNGIEGSLSVAAGAALAQAHFYNNKEVSTNTQGLRVGEQSSGMHLTPNTYIVIGDLSFFYDENALWQQELSGNLRILLLNNGQGGIFRNLKGLDKSPVRDAYVSAQHNTSAEGICKQFGLKYFKATDEASLKEGIHSLTTVESKHPVLLEVMTDVNIDEQQFKAYYHNLIN